MKIFKFGGASVKDAEGVKNVLHVLNTVGHEDVLLVISAMGKTTNKLIELAHSVTNNPNKRELDSLLSTGEQQTITLLAIAMNALGVDAISLTGYQAGFLTSKHHSRALIKDIDTTTIQSHLDQGKIVVVAGFQGATEYGDITTLGRGGSDTTAVAIAAKLGYQCHIFTDVDGVYTAEFDTDSSMFHVNEANDGKGTLTVKDGKMTIHVSLVSKSIVNLFVIVQIQYDPG